MPDQAPNIDIQPGGGRLVYDKASRTIVAERKCHAGTVLPAKGPCPKCGADSAGVCWPGINNDLAELERLRKAMKEIADFCSGDGRNLGAVVRLAEVQSIAHGALALPNGERGTP